jgi:hypothetical protein
VTVTWWAVSFLMKNLTEVLIWSFLKTEVLFVMRIETKVPKNKIFKTQVLKTNSTYFFFFALFLFFKILLCETHVI